MNGVLIIAATVLVILAARSTRRAKRERAAVLTSVVGEPVFVGLMSGSDQGTVRYDAVVGSVDGLRSVRFTSLAPGKGTVALGPGFAPIDKDDTVGLAHVQWVEKRDGTRWTW